MKIIISIIASVLASFAKADAQKISGRITYVATVRNSLFLAGSRDKIDTTYLYFSDTASAYFIEQKSLNISKSDSMNLPKMDPSARELLLETQKRVQQFYSQRFFYHKTGTSTFSEQWLSPGGIGYCMVDTIPVPVWELLPDTARLMGILCYKALCKSTLLGSAEREYTAWYAPGISVSYGPAKFSGLPGLILELDTKYYHFKATAVKIPLLPTEMVKINACKNLPLITRKDADQMVGRQREDMRNMERLRKDQ
jgi:GLPGLI family protein